MQFGVIKINIDSARACEGATTLRPPPLPNCTKLDSYQTRVKLAAHGFQMGIFNPTKDLLGHDPSGPCINNMILTSTFVLLDIFLGF